MNNKALKEQKNHGTAYFPCVLYEHDHNRIKLEVNHHWHKEVELIYLEEGQFLVDINMETTWLEKGFCFINQEELHALKAEGNVKESALVFNLEMLGFSMYDEVQARFIQPILENKLHFPRFIGIKNMVGKEILIHYERIVQWHQQSGQFSIATGGSVAEGLSAQLNIKVELLNILMILQNNGLFLEDKSGSVDYKVESIKKVLSYIEEHYKEAFYVKDLATILNMNEQYFSRFFKRMIGKAPMAYVNDYRLKMAKQLLIKTDMQITEICLEVGFNNMSNFIKLFKNKENCSPIQYRKKS